MIDDFIVLSHFQILFPLLTNNRDVLLDKDLVYRTQTLYIIYDHFLAVWLRRL